MTDQEDEKTKKTLTLKSGTLSLGRKISAAQDAVNSSSKANKVTVVSKKRFAPRAAAEDQSHHASEEKQEADSKLTQDERLNRMKVLENAAKEKIKKEEQEIARKKLEDERLEQVKKEEEERKNLAIEDSEEMSDEADLSQEIAVDIPVKNAEKIVEKHAKVKTNKDENEDEEEVIDPQKNLAKPVKKSKDEIKKGSDKSSKRQLQEIKINLVGTEEVPETITERMRSLASIRRAQQKQKKRREDSGKEYEKVIREVILPDVITVAELANRMAERTTSVVGQLMKLGVMAASNQTIDAETAEIVISTFGHKMKRVKDTQVEDVLKKLDENEDDHEEMKPRAPVVTIMGHVDHGKTSLLDALRSSDVAAGEAGGITQHIGAYKIKVHGDKEITFLDTPGHEAFTAMRLRGAHSTDIVVIVVAADDGIKAQTIEAINHAKAAKVPIIVAINKMDKHGADPTKVRSDLMQHELVPEELGGDVMCVEVSAKNRQNLNGLIDTILLQAEMMELVANPTKQAIGVVVEARVDKNAGPLATVLVQKGFLKVGDIVIAGSVFGKVRALKDDKMQLTDGAGPSTPVEILGLNAAPEAGDKFYVVETEREAREISDFREIREKDLKDARTRRSSSFEELLKNAISGSKELPLVIKTDVQGSLEAIRSSLEKISNEEVKVRIIHAAVGAINESDVSLAITSGAMMIGFNVRAGVLAARLIEKEKIDIRYYSIIYNLIDDVKAALSGMLSPTRREEFLGNVEIREVFNITKVGKVAGAYVTSGMVKRDAGMRLLRDNVVIHEGKLKTLKRFKDDVKEVKAGYECGIAFERFDDIKVGDLVEVFEVIVEKREL